MSARQIMSSAVPLASSVQGGNAWTQQEIAALIASMADADTHERRDWNAVADYCGLRDRTGVSI